MTLKALMAGALLVSTLAVGGAASAQTFQNPNATYDTRGAHGSNQNLNREMQRIARIIASLQNDQSDYGGRKGRAIAYLQRAQNELQAALQYRGR